MSICSRPGLPKLLLSVALLVLASSSLAMANTSLFEFGTDESARLATYQNATGETAFALSLSPQIEDEKQVASDIVIYVDTSASQTGMYRKDTLVMLRRLLANLSAEDRVKLFAIDIEPVELTERFVTPGSDELTVGLDRLRKRVPLGSTDMPKMLEHAATAMDTPPSRNKNVIYIGDGVSRGQFLRTQKFRNLVSDLVSNQVPFSSFAIGPERDIESLSALANQTGGNIFVDDDELKTITKSARGLAATVHASLFWPTADSFKLPAAVAELYPAHLPPLRTDRDSILVGTLKAAASELKLEMSGQVNGEATSMKWPVTVEESNVDFAFLTKLVRDARANNGLTLPTVGSDGLREMARVMTDQSGQLAQLGTQALIRGDYASAKTLSEAALGNDPINAEAEALLNKATQDDDPFGDVGGDDPFGDAGDAGGADDVFGDAGGVPQDDPFNDGGETLPPPQEDLSDPSFEPAGSDSRDGSDTRSDGSDTRDDGSATKDGSDMKDDGSGLRDDRPALPNQLRSGETFDSGAGGGLRLVNPNSVPSRSFDEIDQLLRESNTESRRLLGDEEEIARMLTGRLKQRVTVELQRARDEIVNDAPGDAVERLKSMIDVIDRVINVEPGVRADLRSRLVAALMSARRDKLEYDERLARAQQNIAAAGEIEAARIAYIDRETELAGLINKFDTLLEEREFASAEAVTRAAFALNPSRAATNSVYESAGILSNLEQNLQLRRERQISFLATLYESEKSASAFSGNPPLIFPDAAEWAAKVDKRAKYLDVRLAGNASDEQILNALDEPADLDFEDTPFIEVMDFLRDEYKINVVLDQTARDDSLTEDELITFNVKGIRLKNALRLLLSEKEATFIVRDEVLRIISLSSASDPEFFVTNVYNVGDLVAPRIPIQGGGGIGGGGGGGFGGGGGRGGGGFGGGGQGGGGFGGGGQGGGVFCINDSLTSDKSDAKPTRATSIATPTGDTPLDAWSEYFENHHPDPARVRQTARELMEVVEKEIAKKPSNDELVEDQTNQLTGMIMGAIQNSQSQPWMYEALIVGLRVGNRPESEIARALTSAVDLSYDKNDVLIAAKHMIENRLEKRAVNLLQQVVDFESNSPEAFVMALDAARRVNDEESLKWASLGILNQAWPTHREVVKKAKLAAAGLRLDMKKNGRMKEFNEFGSQLDEAHYRDCIIKVSWTGDADLDLYVEEPGGTICSRKTPRTTAGGVMMGDAFASGPDQSGELAEYYVLPRGFSGDYRLLIRKVWGDVTANKVTVSIYHHFRTDKQTSEQRQLNVGKNGTMVLFNLKDGRRETSLLDHAIETMAEKEIFVGRNAVAHQFREAYSSEAASSYRGSRLDAREGGIGGSVITDPVDQDGFLMPRSVGYMPEITQLFEGSNLSASATTADRLYVLVNAAPFFSAIADVTTFNVLGGADTAGGGGGGGGFGGGGGVGGGGIGGGMF